MADPIRTEDFPGFDTYPGPESRRTNRGGIDLVAANVPPNIEGRMAAGTERESTLQEAAEQIGSTLGRAVKAVQQLPETMDQARTDLRDRMSAIRNSDETDRASGKVIEMKRAARQKMEVARDRAVNLAREARVRAQDLADERPLVVLLGIFVGAFMLGAALRIWRSHE